MGLEIQIPYKGSDYLFQGISGGAASLAHGAEEAIKKFKQKQDAGKAADYFMKAGGEQMYQAAGIHPDEWKTLGADDKAQAVQAIMEQQTMKKAAAQFEDMQAQAEERRQMAASRQQQTDLANTEAEAMPRLAEAIMAGRQPVEGPPMPGQSAPLTRTGTFSPEEIMAGIQTMGKTSPKLAAALSRTLIPKLMEGSSMMTPQFTKSPNSGKSFAYMGHTLMPDSNAFDPSAVMGNLPAGYEGVQTGKDHVSLVKTQKELPSTFHSTMDKLQADISGAQATLEKPDAAFVDGTGKVMKPDQIKTMRGYATNRLKAAQTQGKATIDRYHTGGFMTPEQRDDYLTQLGIEPQAAPGPKAGADAGGKGTKERVTVEKDGKKFTLPRAQLEDAIKQGYKEIK